MKKIQISMLQLSKEKENMGKWMTKCYELTSE